jgi:hypothetical protein
LEVDVEVIILTELDIGEYLINISTQATQLTYQERVNFVGNTEFQTLAQNHPILILGGTADMLFKYLLYRQSIFGGVIYQI